jgi:hypothetical protein
MVIATIVSPRKTSSEIKRPAVGCVAVVSASASSAALGSVDSFVSLIVFCKLILTFFEGYSTTQETPKLQ